MGRTYAGVLGTLAFATTMLRGMVAGAGFQATVAAAMTHLILFAVIGGVLGSLAGWIVADSIRSSFQQQTTSEAGNTSPSS